MVTAMTPEQLDTVLAPKLDAAWHLHRLTRDMDPAAFVMFSSAASIMGNGGQANYAAANMFLNALAEHRRAEGRTAHTLAGGCSRPPGGMTGHLDDADLARMARSGIAPVSNEQALTLLDTALTIDHPTLVPARFDLAALRTRAAAGPLPPVLRRLVHVPRRPRGTPGRAPCPGGSPGCPRGAGPAHRRAGTRTGRHRAGPPRRRPSNWAGRSKTSASTR
ncbi:hypothetical protein GCM10017744_013940 [Streptomyces antimycoticus]